MELLTIFYAVLAATLGFGAESRAVVMPAGGPAQSVSIATAPCSAVAEAQAPAVGHRAPVAAPVVPRLIGRLIAPDMVTMPARLMFGQRRE